VIIYIPAGNIFRVFAVARTVRISDFENGSDGTTVFSGDSFQTDVVFATVFRVGMTGEGTSSSDLSGSGTCETSGYLWKYKKNT